MSAAGPTTRMHEHVAIVMDGNGRWAKMRGLPRFAGHKRGADTVRRVVKDARDLGIGYLTLFGFSSENWKRPADEVGQLMDLIRLYLRSELRTLRKQGVRFRMIGDRDRLRPRVIEAIGHAEDLTRANRAITLTVALSYGGRAEIIAATRRLAAEIGAAAIDEAAFAQRLFTADMPDPDVVIRTSGEQRLSNFLLWQCAEAELVYLDTLWPDFSRAELAAVITALRERQPSPPDRTSVED